MWCKKQRGKAKDLREGANFDPVGMVPQNFNNEEAPMGKSQRIASTEDLQSAPNSAGPSPALRPNSSGLKEKMLLAGLMANNTSGNGGANDFALAMQRAAMLQSEKNSGSNVASGASVDARSRQPLLDAEQAKVSQFKRQQVTVIHFQVLSFSLSCMEWPPSMA